MAEAYITREEAALRLSVDVADAPSDLQLRIASDRVDASGPFKGYLGSTDQERQFPRIPSDGGSAGPAVVPDSVLDAVCILARADAEDHDETPVRSVSDLDSSISYATASVPKHLTQAAVLLKPYQLISGRML